MMTNCITQYTQVNKIGPEEVTIWQNDTVKGNLLTSQVILTPGRQSLQLNENQSIQQIIIPYYGSQSICKPWITTTEVNKIKEEEVKNEVEDEEHEPMDCVSDIWPLEKFVGPNSCRLKYSELKRYRSNCIVKKKNKQK